MNDADDRIKVIEEEIRNTHYNKATQKHVGLLKAKMARIKKEKERSGKSSGGDKGIRKGGDATCAICGSPSVGKSALFNALTNAESKVGSYDFTTLKSKEGMILHKGAHIQILDTPGLIKGASSGRGMGREILSTLRVSDLLIVLMDPRTVDRKKNLIDELGKSGIRLNKTKPQIIVKKSDRGGIEVSGFRDEEFLKEIARASGLINAMITVGRSVSVEDVIDFFTGNISYTKAIFVLNKAEKNSIHKGFDLCISVKESKNLNALKDMIFGRLELIRVYTDRDEPMILRRGSTVRTLATKLHRDFEAEFKRARVWGDSARYAGQIVGLDHTLRDGDTLRIELRK